MDVETSEMASEGIKVVDKENKPLKYKDRDLMVPRIPLSTALQLGHLFEVILIEGGNNVVTKLYVVDWKDPKALMDTWALILLSGACSPTSQPLVLSWLGKVLKVPALEFENPDIFPLSTLGPIIRAIMKHPDIASFFPEMREMISESLSPETKEKIKKFLEKLSKITSNA